MSPQCAHPLPDQPPSRAPTLYAPPVKSCIIGDMSTKTIIETIDDIDGSTEDVETVQFSYLGTDYEIDLAQKSRTTLDDALAEFVAHARRVGGRRRSSAPAASREGSGRLDNLAIRAWAEEQGLQVNRRGRLPKSLLEAYQAAH
jgi:hypothetical protein